MNCFLAAHGTGKTTLAREIVKRKDGLYVTDAFARPIKRAAAKTGLSDEQVQVLNFELMMWAQENYYDQNVLTTRSLFDSIIFARLLTPDLPFLPEIEEHVRMNKGRIKNIFYLPIEFPFVDDGVRYGAKLQLAYDEEIKKLVREYDLWNIVHRISGTVDERLNQILTLL